MADEILIDFSKEIVSCNLCVKKSPFSFCLGTSCRRIEDLSWLANKYELSLIPFFVFQILILPSREVEIMMSSALDNMKDVTVELKY